MSTEFSHPNAQPFELEGGDSAMLLIHGFTGSPGHMRPIGEAVRAAGFTARGILLPGHGTSIEDMARSDWKGWLAACEDAMKEMKRKYRRVSVGGLSMGGILTLLMAERLDPACVVLYAPAMRYKTGANYLSPAVKRVVKSVPWKPHGYKDFLYEYDFGYDGAPVSKVEDMTHLQRMAWRGIAGVTCPVLVIQSHHDESVHATVPDRVLARVGSAVREACWVDASPHVCTLGADRAYVMARTVDFLKRYGV